MRTASGSTLEIVVDRDPDGDTTLTYFMNGREMSAEELGVTEHHVDPGRSGADAEWQESMYETAAGASPAASALIQDLTESYSS